MDTIADFIMAVFIIFDVIRQIKRRARDGRGSGRDPRLRHWPAPSPPPTSGNAPPVSSVGDYAHRTLSRDSYGPWSVSRANAQCCDGECVCDGRTVIAAWWITSTRSPCTKARADSTAAAGTGGSIRTLRSSNGVRGMARRPAGSGPRTLITSLRESQEIERSRISRLLQEGT